MELPEYTVYVETPRLLFPKTLKMIFLGMFLYLAVWINFFILKKPMAFSITILIMIGIIILIVATTLKNYTEYSNYKYQFFSNRIEFYGKNSQMIMYSQVQAIKLEKNLFDILFNTGTINLGNLKISHVPNLNQVYFYVQKMVQMYHQYQYQTQNPYQQQYQNQQQIYQQQYSQQQYQRPKYNPQQYQNQQQPSQQQYNSQQNTNPNYNTK